MLSKICENKHVLHNDLIVVSGRNPNPKLLLYNIYCFPLNRVKVAFAMQSFRLRGKL